MGEGCERGERGEVRRDGRGMLRRDGRGRQVRREVGESGKSNDV